MWRIKIMQYTKRHAKLMPSDRTKKIGALDTNRTCDPPLRRGMLYPLSYEGSCGGCVVASSVMDFTRKIC